MARGLRLLVLGASHGCVIACRMLGAGHAVRLVCDLDRARLLQSGGFRVWLPVPGQPLPLEIDSRRLAGKFSASGPAGIDPAAYDLVVLALQEPQYLLPGFRELLAAIGRTSVPCVSLMNIPPLPYMRRLPTLDAEALAPAYAEAGAWAGLAPSRLTHCSPEAPAVRPDVEQPNLVRAVLPVRLRIAPYESLEHTAILHQLAQGSDAAVPLEITVSDSVHVPLAVWPMALAGSYRCITSSGIRCAREAVLGDIAASRSIYEFVAEVCVRIGVRPQDMASFDDYAAAAESLAHPDVPARALQDGAQAIERTDRLVQIAAGQHRMRHPAIDRLVALVDRRVENNRRFVRH